MLQGPSAPPSGFEIASKSWRHGILPYTLMKGAIFIMRLTLKQKMKMCEEHVIKRKSISHASEIYDGYGLVWLLNSGKMLYHMHINKREKDIMQRQHSR